VTLLVGYIPSSQGDAALDAAVAEARRRGTDLVVVNIARGEAVLETRRLYDDQAQALAARLESTGVPFTLRRELEDGDAADALLDVARQIDPEYIVIGLRRRSATGKLLFGSNAQRILMDAPCPVITVKAPA
jgi:nucleotide-binding universal stress UspA family protein